jgi:hypothetical protein
MYSTFVADESICFQSQDLYLKAHIDVEVSSGEDDVSRPDALVDKPKKSADDDAGDRGVSSAELITTNPISCSVSKQSDPSTAVRVTAPVLLSGKRGQKCPPPATRCNKPVDQVMTQIELPPYRGPRNPLDVVAIEIIFGCIFEVF